MENNERMLNIIEDHALICSFLVQLVYAIENDADVPNFVPVPNDTLLADRLGTIAGEIKRMRGH